MHNRFCRTIHTLLFFRFSCLPQPSFFNPNFKTIQTISKIWIIQRSIKKWALDEVIEVSIGKKIEV